MTPNDTRTQIKADPQSASNPRQESAKALSSQQRKSRILGWLERYALVAVLILIFAFFSFYGPTSSTFPTTANLKVVLGGQAVLAIVALGALIPLVCKEWDLSVGASAGLSAVVAAKLMSDGTPLAVALIAGVLLGLTVGTANALIITRLGTNAVITTLGTAAIVAGVVNQITGGTAQVSNIPRSLVHFGSGDAVLGIPNTTLVLIVVACAVYFMLVHTPFGRYIYALGSNPNAARLVGLRTRLTLALTFVLAGGLAGIAGVLQVARAGGADPSLGNELTLPALAAAFLSAAAIKPGRYNVGGLLVALFLLAFLNSGLTIAGAEPYVTQYVNGVALIAGVALAVNIGRKGRA
jgi:ribose transport system permease protein